MTREECEKLILLHVKQIEKIYKEYEGDGNYLTMAIVDGNLSCNNDYWEEGIEPIHCHLDQEGTYLSMKVIPERA